MSLSVVHTRACVGIEAPQVNVEVHLTGGLPALHVVGLPDSAVRESRDRVRSALLNANFQFPNQRITVNLAPADLPKDGGRFDLAIAVGILAASGQVPSTWLEHLELSGELALSGEVRGVSGTLPAAIAAQRAGRGLLLAAVNADEAALARDARVYPVQHLLEATQLLHAAALPNRHIYQPEVAAARIGTLSLDDVIGQHAAKRALLIAASGGHNLIMIGPPGTGKTMLARRLPGLLPPPSAQEALEISVIQSVAQRQSSLPFGTRPFRDPHHTASAAALVGGGSIPRPGEVSMAHGGVLFLDELPEFQRRVLEVLREPLESGEVTIARARGSVRYPARFQLVAAMNPCPAGFDCKGRASCQCTPEQSRRYRERLSGPLLDRIDLHVDVPSVPVEWLSRQRTDVAQDWTAQVSRAVSRQRARNRGLNRDLTNGEINLHCRQSSTAQKLLNQAVRVLGLSARSYHRVIRVARTVADLAGAEIIEDEHMGEALSYRKLDRAGGFD